MDVPKAALAGLNAVKQTAGGSPNIGAADVRRPATHWLRGVGAPAVAQLREGEAPGCVLIEDADAGRFEKVFGACSTVDQNGDKAFTATELTKMIIANRETLLGSLVSMVEWQVLLALAADTKAVERAKAVPALSVARMKSFYDGTLFYKLAKEHA